MENRSRALAILAALVGWTGLSLQIGLTVHRVISNGGSVPGALWLWVGYFTITTNMLAAAVLSASALGPVGPISRRLGSPGVQSMTTMSIIIVGLIYNFLLRGLWHPQGWQLVADVTLHDVMPLLFLLHWWVNVPKAELRVRQISYWQLYPIAYFAYALIRGAMDGWYPYPFLDVSTLGYARVAINAAVILLAFIAIASLLVVLGRGQARRRSRSRILPAS
jgi:hypothetical protein